MLSRQDLTSPSRQDKNAGNSGDLVKHTVYLAMLYQLRSGKHLRIVEGRGGKCVYVSSNPHLRKALQAAQYCTSALGRAQAECFASPPTGLGVVADLAEHEIAYAGSGALHANAVANGVARSLELLDSDAAVRSVAERVFSEDCFSKVRENLRTTNPDGPSEPLVLSRLESGAFGSLAMILSAPRYRRGARWVSRCSVRYCLVLTVAAYYTWHGTNLEERGVAPDVDVPISTESLLNGGDNQLSRAIECLGHGVAA